MSALVGERTVYEQMANEDKKLDSDMSSSSVMIYGTIALNTSELEQRLSRLEKVSIRENLQGLVSDQEIDLMLDSMGRAHPLLRGDADVTWGYAIFASEGQLKYFQKPFRLPSTVDTEQKLDLRKLISALHIPSHFYILSLHKDVTRLFLCGAGSTEELPLQDAIHYTHDERDRASDSYFSRLDQYLTQLLRNDDGLVFIAGSGYGQAIFRAITHLRNVDPVTLVAIKSDADLAAARHRASLMIDLHYRDQVTEAKRRYYSNEAQGLTSAKPTAILEYARKGRVDTLFVTDKLETDIINEAVKQAILSDAAVYILPVEDMPAPTLAAVLKHS